MTSSGGIAKLQPVENSRKLDRAELQRYPSPFHPDGQQSTAVWSGAMASMKTLGGYRSGAKNGTKGVKIPLEVKEPALSLVATPAVVQSLGHAIPGEK